MYRKLLFIWMFVLLLLCTNQKTTYAHMQLEELQNEAIQILVVFSNETSQTSANVGKLDLLLHHFTNHVKIVPDYEVSKTDFESATHVF